MPEIAEVARVVHFIRKHLVDRTIACCIATDDANVYGKNKEGATTGAEFEKHMTGNKVIDAGQQGQVLLDGHGQGLSPSHALWHERLD